MNHRTDFREYTDRELIHEYFETLDPYARRELDRRGLSPITGNGAIVRSKEYLLGLSALREKAPAEWGVR